MSDSDIDFDEGGDEEGGKKKLSGKVMVLFIALPAIVVIGGIVGALFAFGILGGSEDPDEMAVVEEEQAPPVFFDMPEFLVNMSAPDGAMRYLKLRVALEVPDADALPEIELLMPRIVDGFQVYLRELRPADLEGSAGIVRMKEELLRRLNLAIEPHHIRDVLFKEVVVQ